MKHTIQIFSFLVVGLCATQAFAHAHITSPTARNDIANKEAAAPCGGARGTAHTLVGGETLKLEWEETIDHPGYYIIRFSEANDENFGTLVTDIPDRDGGGSYSYDLQIPSAPCDDCTIQLIQVMEDRNPPTNYYSCLDVEIVAPGSDMGPDPVDMGPDPVDMGTDPTNNGVNNAVNNGNNGVADMGGSQPDTGAPTGDNNVSGEGESCSTTLAPQSDASPWALLLMGGVLLRRRRTE